MRDVQLRFAPALHHAAYALSGQRCALRNPAPWSTTTETLLLVPQYDFNWQLKYLLQAPVFVQKGTRVIMTFHYNNSASNTFNPDPARTIRWGEPSEEEMMSGWIDYIEAPANAAISSLTR